MVLEGPQGDAGGSLQGTERTDRQQENDDPRSRITSSNPWPRWRDWTRVAKGAIEKAGKAATHDSKTIKAYRDWIAWLFAFGLIGLGMQITGKALKQAGGAPLIIGGVVGTVKAVGSLIVVLMFVKEFI